jgi:zinc D-Ala-D-Ala carboxypeptidase
MNGARTQTTRLLAAFLLLFLAGAGVAAVTCSSASKAPAAGAAKPAATATTTAQALAQPTPQLPADTSLLTVVTQTRSLAASYVPPDLVPISPQFTSSVEVQQLRRPAADALAQMLSDARRDGVTVKVNSAYRSYDYQGTVLRAEIAAYGCSQALKQVAAPGHSEHQLGLAADLTSEDVHWDLSDGFGQTPEGRWLAAHAATYGFVLSYPEGKEAVTGYISEPWHYRYVSPSVAQATAVSGKTPAEYLMGLGGAADTGIEKTQALAPAGYGCS